MKTLSLGGREVPVRLAAWDPDLRRAGSLAVIGVAAVLVLLGVALQVLAPGATAALTALVVLMAIVVVFEGAVITTGVLQERDATTGATSGAHGGEVLTLQCSECATQFDIHDDGTRPLYHACPGCGAEGVLGEEAEGAYAGAPEAAQTQTTASAGHQGHTHAHPAEDAAAPAAPAKPLRKLKLRCPGCETIFVVEDFGERPLRTECPGCARRGELK